MRSLAAAFAAALLVGCAGMSEVAETPAQKLHARDGAYRALLALAVAYKEACDARPQPARASCLPVVARLRELDTRYAAARQRAMPGDDPALAPLDAALGAFNAYIAAGFAAGAIAEEVRP